MLSNKDSKDTRIGPRDQVISAIRYREVIRLLESSFPHNYALIKGEALSILAYGCVGKRHLGDIDILVTKDTVSELIGALVEDGYVPKDDNRKGQVSAFLYSHQSTPYVKKGPWGSLEVDINFEIVWGEWKQEKPKVEEMLSRRIPITIYGEQTYTLNPQDAMIFGCLNLYREINSEYHLWTHNPIRTERFMELNCLYQVHKSNISIYGIQEWGIQNHLWPMIWTILRRIGEVSGDTELSGIVETFGIEEEIEMAECFGLGEIKYQWPIRFEERLDNDHIPEMIDGILEEADKFRILFERTVFGGKQS